MDEIALTPVLRRPQVRAAIALAVLFVGLLVYAELTPLGPRLLDPVRFKAVELERLRATLPDPESVRFRDEFVSGTATRLVLCGSVNFRDDAGSLVGYRRFVSAPGLRALEGSVDGSTMDSVWQALCTRKR